MMIRKLIIAAVLIPAVWFGSAVMHFPRVFQVMLMIYILLGLGVFLLLDAPSVPRVEGWKAVAALVAFYLVLSAAYIRSEEHTSELQSQSNLVCRLLLEKKKKNSQKLTPRTVRRPHPVCHLHNDSLRCAQPH